MIAAIGSAVARTTPFEMSSSPLPRVPLARLLCAALSLSLALPEATALAAAPSEPVPTEAPTEAPAAAATADNPAVALSRAHFQSGLAAYEREDYAEAISQWEQAHALMGSVPELIGPRHIMQLDLGQAHLRAYDRDGDAAHLGSARGLLESYVAWLDRPGHTLTPSEHEDRPRAVNMLARVDILSASTPGAQPLPPPRVERRTQVDRKPKSVTPIVSRKAARGMIIGGGVSLGLGVAGIAGILVGMRFAVRAEHDYEVAQANALDRNPSFPNGATDAELAATEDADRRGRVANRGVIASATFAALGLLVGIPVLAAGLVARRRHLRAAPAVARGYAGAQVGFSF